MRSRGKTQERWIKVRQGPTKSEGTTQASIQTKLTQGGDAGETLETGEC